MFFYVHCQNHIYEMNVTGSFEIYQRLDGDPGNFSSFLHFLSNWESQALYALFWNHFREVISVLYVHCQNHIYEMNVTGSFEIYQGFDGGPGKGHANCNRWNTWRRWSYSFSFMASRLVIHNVLNLRFFLYSLSLFP